MHDFKNFTTLLNLIGITIVNQEFNEILTNIVESATLQRHINTIIYTSHENWATLGTTEQQLESDSIIQALEQSHGQPFLLFDHSAPIEPFVKKFNTEVLIIAKLKQETKLDKNLLMTLWQRLWRITKRRLILLFDSLARREYIERILNLCAQHHAMHVIALQPHMAVTERRYWTLRLFPTQKVLKCAFPAYYKNIFLNHLKNMRGYPLRVIESAWYPQSYKYTPSVGNITLSGFLGRALVEYANHHNATLEIPISVNHRALNSKELEFFFENDTLDIGSLAASNDSDGNMSYSVVFQHNDWCLMVPLEEPLQKSTFYYTIIDRTVMLIFSMIILLISFIWITISRWQNAPNHFGNVLVLRGLLGMPFCATKHISFIHKIIYITIALAGVIVNTTYCTYLQSFTVDAPLDNKIMSIADILQRGIKIAVGAAELPYINLNKYFRVYAENFTIFDNFTEFLLLRDSLDTRYAFTVTDMWAIYDEQQKYFSRPLFRLTDICIHKNFPMVLPLQESSLHRRNLNLFLSKLHESGLIKHWRRHSFYEMLEMHAISLEDRNKLHGFQPMKVEDLAMILLTLSVLMAACFLCFALEILWMKTGKMIISAFKKNCYSIN